MPSDGVTERLTTHERPVSPTVRRIGQFIDQNRLFVVASSAAELAQSLGTSDATVIRSVQALGFAGLGDLRQMLVDSLSASASSPAEAMRRTLADVGASAEAAVANVIDTHLDSIRVLSTPTVQRKIVAATRALHPAHRILVFGIGPSAGIADYMRRLLTRNGRPSLTIGATGNEFADRLIELRAGDGLLILAYGRAYPELELLFEEASRLALPVVLVTDKLDRSLTRRATVVLPARRGREERVALHAATLVVLEAIALALSAAERAGSIEALERLTAFRQRLSE